MQRALLWTFRSTSAVLSRNVIKCTSGLTHPRQYSNPTISKQSDETSSTIEPIDTSNENVQISDSTVKRLKKVAGSGEFLRVMIDSGGCKGFNYVFKLDTQMQTDDRVFERDQVKVVVDAESLQFLKGKQSFRQIIINV
jgi:iron-sulfur cluster assembly accessory protein